MTALAGGVGAGKFLRGLASVVPPGDLTSVINTGDDIILHGLHISPDLDSVLYWLAGVADRERGWGREGETFRTTEELRRLEVEGSWFGLGDLDLATHLIRTSLLSRGDPLSAATARLAEMFAVSVSMLPMTDDEVTTRVDVVDSAGVALDLHFQEYWVLRGARDEVKGVRYSGASESRPAPGVLEAIQEAEAVLICPSNPIASIGPILAVPGLRDALSRRRETVAGVSPIVGGAPLRGMADKLLPVAGVEVSAAGVADHYREVIGGWIIDREDSTLASPIREAGTRVRVTDTIMVDDNVSTELARIALEVALGGDR